MNGMRLAWLIVALVPGLSGCFGSHGGGGGGGGDEDAGPRPDGGGGMCLELPGDVNELRCPMGGSEGEPISVVINTSPTRCCSSGTPRATATPAPGGFTISVEWTACDCCTGCRCVGPIEEVEVPLGPLGRGTYTVTTDGGASCSFVVGAPPECSPITADETRMPRVVYTDQLLAVTLTQRMSTGGCGCEPRVSDGGGTLDFRMQICSCCRECDCIDPGYQASREVGPLPRGEYEVVIPHGVAQVLVRPPGSCIERVEESVEIFGPDPGLRIGGPALWWARITGTELLCCAAPLPAVEEGVGPMGEIVLGLASCVDADCDCDPPRPTPVEAWHSLGALAPGTYTVVAGTARTTFVVP